MLLDGQQCVDDSNTSGRQQQKWATVTKVGNSDKSGQQ